MGVGVFLVLGGLLQNEKLARVRLERQRALIRIRRLEEEIATHEEEKRMQQRDLQVPVFNSLYSLFHLNEQQDE